jgi:hypothetical protein
MVVSVRHEVRFHYRRNGGNGKMHRAEMCGCSDEDIVRITRLVETISMAMKSKVIG